MAAAGPEPGELQVDSRRPGKGRKAGVARRHADNRVSGWQGAGRRPRTTRARAPPGDPAASRPLRRLLPTRPRLRTAAGPSGAEPGRVRAASAGLVRVYPGSGRRGSGSRASRARGAASARGSAGGSGVRALKPTPGPLPSQPLSPPPPPPPPPPASPDATPAGDVSHPRRAGSGLGCITWYARVGLARRSRLEDYIGGGASARGGLLAHRRDLSCRFHLVGSRGWWTFVIVVLTNLF